MTTTSHSKIIAHYEGIRNRAVYEQFMNFIRAQPCCVCTAPSDPHHIKTVGAEGENYYVAPVCRRHHTEFHNIGKLKFEEKNNVNLYDVLIVMLVSFIDNQITVIAKESK